MTGVEIGEISGLGSRTRSSLNTPPTRNGIGRVVVFLSLDDGPGPVANAVVF